MRLPRILLYTAAALSATASAQTIRSPSGVVYTLKGCARQDSGLVRCTFALQSQYATRPFLRASTITVTTSTGVVIPGDHAEASGKVLEGVGAVAVAAGNVEVPYSIYFAVPASENTLKILTFSQQVVYTDVPIAGAAQVSDRLPGQAAWRKTVTWNNRQYVAMVPGCYATGATATCVVNLYAVNARATTVAGTYTYPVTTLELQGQPVSGGTATVTVGATTFTGIPVR